MGAENSNAGGHGEEEEGSRGIRGVLRVKRGG